MTDSETKTPLEQAIAAIEPEKELADPTGDGQVEKKREVLMELAHATLTVIMDRPWDGASLPDNGLQLLLVSDGDNQEQAMLAVFTRESRAREFMEEFIQGQGGFEHIAEVPAAWAILGIPDGAGAMINPNYKESFRIDHSVAARLKEGVVDAMQKQQQDQTAGSGNNGPVIQ